MLSGKPKAGTPNATRGHTNIHLAFMSSQQFKDAFTPEIASNFAKHIKEEEKAQEIRSQADPQALMGQFGELGRPTPRSTAQGIQEGPTKAANPAKMIGSEETPQGQMT